KNFMTVSSFVLSYSIVPYQAKYCLKDSQTLGDSVNFIRRPKNLSRAITLERDFIFGIYER
ncbi:MAG: hypothetical protein E6X66_11450, partial [Streptococcus salivarius]|nr:hypothetical protein [Streptococcus salivarius]